MALLYKEDGGIPGNTFQLARSNDGGWFYRYNENAPWHWLPTRLRHAMLTYVTSDATGPDEIMQGGKLFRLLRTVQPDLPTISKSKSD